MRVVADVECERGDFPVTWRIGMGESASLVLSNEALAARRWALFAPSAPQSAIARCSRAGVVATLPGLARAYVEIRFNLLVILERGEVRWR